MNAVEIEAAVSDLVASPFEPQEFPYAFLAAFGNKETTLAKLRKGNANATDVPGAVLQRNNIHLAVVAQGQVATKLNELKTSLKTAQAKAKFVLATDGFELEAEDLNSGETLVCDYNGLAEHFGFFLPLAGISTIKEIKDNPIDIRATARLNKLYLELLKENPDWATEEKRPDLNQFLARIIFCFFAEDTGIFATGFTETLQAMSEPDGSNLSFVLSEIFRAMDLSEQDKKQAHLPEWAKKFPYVHGNLFGTLVPTPRFSKIARSYLLRAGELNWKEINPDIFGSMIQAVAEDEERGMLGMHYTSVPNILKVLNPLVLDDLREQLEKAGDHRASLLKLRERISRIRVFDPACGSGNFLVIVYKEMRAIEGEINRRRNEIDRPSDIYLTNFRGIEIRGFAAEVARLALIIAEFQCDVKHRGPKLALAEFLPLSKENWIVAGNALRIDWGSICPPRGKTVDLKSTAQDLFETPLDQSMIEFSNDGGETYICGNPPYKGSQTQTKEQKADLENVFKPLGIVAKHIDYVGGWLMKAVMYAEAFAADIAFVSTNSICQGRTVPALWPEILKRNLSINFAYTSFKWTNLASDVAGVTVVIIGLTKNNNRVRKLYIVNENNETIVRLCENITPYLTTGHNILINSSSKNINKLDEMSFGSMPNDGGYLLLKIDDIKAVLSSDGSVKKFLKKFLGSQEFIRGMERWCIWVSERECQGANSHEFLRKRFEEVRRIREMSQRKTTIELAAKSYSFGEIRQNGSETAIIVPRVSSENREYLPVGLLPQGSIVSDSAFAMFDAPLWNMAIIASRLHLVWIATVCGKLKTDFRYSNTLGWNTFPMPTLTEQNRADLTRCAEEILLARERHYPKTIADLYDPDDMPDDLKRAHELNDETLERIYIGRRFKNDTERLEKLFEMYAKLTANDSKVKGKKG
jgi:hypothetical protein